MEYILDGACIGVALKRDLCMEECEGRREEELVVLSVSYMKFSSWPSKAAARWGWERYGGEGGGGLAIWRTRGLQWSW